MNAELQKLQAELEKLPAKDVIYLLMQVSVTKLSAQNQGPVFAILDVLKLTLAKLPVAMVLGWGEDAEDVRDAGELLIDRIAKERPESCERFDLDWKSLDAKPAPVTIPE